MGEGRFVYTEHPHLQMYIVLDSESKICLQSDQYSLRALKSPTKVRCKVQVVLFLIFWII